MDETFNVGGLLQETELISETERDEILEEIDEEFRSFLHHPDSESDFTFKSRGLLIPLIIGLAAIIAASVIIGFSVRKFSRESDSIPFIQEESGFSTQWQILSLYLEESDKVLKEKDAEIEYYREEIRNYDERINTLRELLRLKDETQNWLFIERQRLSNEGLDENQISERLSTMESEATAGLSPEILEIYDLSIEEINIQIDRILNDRKSSEERLNESIAERELVAKEAAAVEEEIRIRESESFVSNEVLQTIDRLNSIITGYEQLGSSRSAIKANYSKILGLIDDGEYESALAEVGNLERVIQDEVNQQNPELQFDLSLENQAAAVVKEYVRFLMLSEMKIVSENDATGELTQSEEGRRPTVDELDVKAVEPVPVLIGIITTADFNRIRIRPAESVTVEIGEVFQIFRDVDDGESLDIGSGVITLVSTDEISGKLQSLAALSNKPESGDEVYISR
jgi:hypothetical protein